MKHPGFDSRATAAEISPAPDSRGGIFDALALFAVAMGLAAAVSAYRQFQFGRAGQAAVYGFDNWLRAFTDPATMSALWMSFLLVRRARLIPAMIVGVMFAWLIARTDMPGGKCHRVFLLDRVLYSGFSADACVDFASRS